MNKKREENVDDVVERMDSVLVDLCKAIEREKAKFYIERHNRDVYRQIEDLFSFTHEKVLPLHIFRPVGEAMDTFKIKWLIKTDSEYYKRFYVQSKEDLKKLEKCIEKVWQ